MASTYLDALRALGANLVVAAHLPALYFGIGDRYALGSLGVAMFFLLSGFLIMQSMLAWLDRPQPRLAGFIADRFARIMTPYVPALVLIALANVAVIRSQHGLAGQGTGILAFVGNLALQQDHPVFQVLELAGVDAPWRIRPYNSAEPFWTVAIEMWIYVSVGLFFFCLLNREKIDRLAGTVLAAVSVPVLVWNAAAGGGRSLSLVWLLGALAGYLFHRWRAMGYANIRAIAGAVCLFGIMALIGRAGKIGFQPFDFQTATLLAMVMFGGLGLTMSIHAAPAGLRKPMTFLASYSYSLYLIHNTILIVVLESAGTQPGWPHVVLALAAAHIGAYALYLGFERHYRRVGVWVRPAFERMLKPVEHARDVAAGTPTGASRPER